MLTKKTVEVPAKTIEVIESITCELCGSAAKDVRAWPRHDKSGANLNETTIEYKHGWSYPEDGDIETIILDICPKCFKEKLIPWLESQGGKIRKEASEW